MIIKINKLHILAIAVLVVCVSFIFAINAEKNNKADTVSAESYVKLPVIMYHHITENNDKAGNYTVTTKELEKDLEYIKSKGYTAVSVSDLINYVYDGTPLPEKPIAITFDDGFESYSALACPIMKKLNMKSSVFIIGSAADLYTKVCDHNISYSNLNWDAVAELMSSPLCEVHSHTYDLHHNEKGERKGMSRLEGESNESYSKAIKQDLMKLQNLFKENSLDAPTAIAYPYGAYDDYTAEIIKEMGFKVSFTCVEKINRISYKNPECLYDLGRYNRESGIPTERFFTEIMPL